MAANYDLSKPIEKRVRFFDGQFLQDQDFVDEQKYHLDRARRHNRQLHLSGIVEGLTVTKGANNQVTVAPGTAIDSDGRQLVLVEIRQADLVPADKFNDKQGIQLYIRYRESAVDQQTGTGSADNTRWLESPELVVLAPGESLSSGMPPVLLAQLTLDNKGVVTVDNSVRQYSGLRLPGPAADAPTLRTTATGRVALAGALTLEGNVSTGTSKLEVVQGEGLAIKVEPTSGNTVAIGRTEQNSLQFDYASGQVINSTASLSLNIDSDANDTERFIDFRANGVGFAGGSSLLRILETGHVGIGTTTVDNPGGWNRVVDILGTGHARLLVRSSGGVKTTVNSHDTWDGAVGVVGTDTNHALRLMTNGAQRLTVDTSGNVGINTTSPDSRLTINGNITHDNNYNSYGDAPLTIFEPTSNGGTTPAALRDILTLVREGVSGQAFGNKASFALGRYENNGTNSRTQLDIKLTDSAFNTHTAVLSLRSNGNIGVGVTSPASRLHIDNGRVDITTSNDSAGGQNRFTGLLGWDAVTNYRRGQLVLSSSYSDLVIASSKANDNHGSTLTFVTSDPNDATKYRKWVVNQGNWGARKQFLDFGYGDAESRANPHDNISSTETVLTLDGVNKRVGIGVTSPGAKLEVAGEIKFTGDNLKTNAIARIAPLYIRGTGLNNSGNRVLIIGSTAVYNTNGRGLTLTILNKADHSVVSTTNYDTYLATTNSESLSTALNGITKSQIGVLTSFDAWESSVTNNLRTAFRRVGLYKAATIGGDVRRPYAAIFEAASVTTVATAKAIEVLHNADSNAPFAELRGWLMDGSFVATASAPNALANTLGTEPAVVVDEASNVEVKGRLRAATVIVTSPMANNMYPGDPLVYQNIFEAKNANIIRKIGTPLYDETSYAGNTLWNDRNIIRYGGDTEADGNGAEVTIPDGYDTLWVRVLGERWTTMKAYFTDGNREQLGLWPGGYRSLNCYCPDGSLSDGYDSAHQWVPIPTRRSGRVALIPKTGTNSHFWISGLAFSRNPWGHAAQSAVGYYWASNGGEATRWATDGHNWKNDVLAYINSKTNPELKVPVVNTGRDKLLYVVEHNSDWNGSMHNGVTVNGTPIERLRATYDNPFARHWNSKFYERYIAARIPASLITANTLYLSVRIDMSKQNNNLNFREIGTHDLDMPTAT